LNDTVRNNITFGLDYDKQWYETVIGLCELIDDLEILPGGDLTQIGERGINLSGGQKQRVSIARAVYSRADIYIIDDALSALDANVGKNVMNKVFVGILKGKTRILVTHKLKLIEHMDRVYLMKNGTIAVESSSHYIKLTPEYQDLADEESKNEDKNNENALEEDDLCVD
jgi:ATP-binding cassette, subfamily C (CFTR/MRP), member 1